MKIIGQVASRRTKGLRAGLLARSAVVALTLGATATLAPAAYAQTVQADIRAQSLGDALMQLSRQANVDISAPSSVTRGKRASAVKGAMDVETALRRLLAGSGLSARKIRDRSFIVELSTGEADAGSAAAESMSAESAASMGDDDASTMEEKNEIVVTAQKRRETVQDVPMSVAVIDSEEISRRGLAGMEDYLRSIAGVAQVDQGAGNNSIIIRGISTTAESENFFSGTTVSTYFGETSITGAAGPGQAGIDVRLVDIQRIEVLKGPQGTAFGDAALGGTLRLIPNPPNLDRMEGQIVGGYSSTEYRGSDNSLAQGVINVPLVQGTLGLRAVAYHFSDSGFYQNVAGEDQVALSIANNAGIGSSLAGYMKDDVGRMRSYGARVSALWTPSNRFDLSLNYLTQRIRQDGVPAATIADFQQSRFPILPEARVREETGDTTDTRINLYNAVANYDLGPAVLTAVVSLVDGGSAFANDLSLPLGFPVSNRAPSDYSGWTAETRIASQGSGRFEYLLGAFYQHIDETFSSTLFAILAPGSAAQSIFTRDIDRDVKQLAGFSQLSYNVTEKLKVTVGGRAFTYDKKQRDLVFGSGDTLKSSDTHTTFNANIRYSPNRDATLYASWAQGFRLGRPDAGALPQTCDLDDDGIVDNSLVTLESTRQIDSDTLDSYEVGAKFRTSDRRLGIDLSIYHIDWKGLPIRTVIGAACGFTANAGAATSDGVEAHMSFRAFDGLLLEGSFGYAHAVLSEDAPGLGAFRGARLPASPKVNASLSAQYDFLLGRRTSFIRLDSLYIGKYYADILETPSLASGDYVKFDLSAGIKLGQVSVNLFARNLTDEDSVTYRSPILGANRLRPRTVGLRVGYDFQ
jgi:outer membrane receptor protein involved in Fe transport